MMVPVIAPTHHPIIGKIRVHPRGFGFFIPDNRELLPEDVFIPKTHLRGAVDGDLVEIILLRPSSKGPEGKVTKIMTRAHATMAATVCRITAKKEAWAHCILLGSQWIQLKHCKVNLGDRVLIRMIRWGSNHQAPLGEVIHTFGSIADPGIDKEVAIAEYRIRSDFPEEVMQEALAFGSSVSATDKKNRRNLTDIKTITIDPKGAKDFDDALSLAREGPHFRAMVHIADVSHYVTPGSCLDAEAALRANSVYFPDGVVPMLPHALSSHLCSLKPNVQRLTVTVSMHFNEEGELLDYEIFRSVIKSDRRFTYEEALAILNGQLESPFRPLLEQMVELCHVLKKQRGLRGSMEFSLPDLSIELDANQFPTGMHIVEYDITHQLVEELMLKANEVVATHLSEQGKKLTYRIHDRPLTESMQDFISLANALGFSLPQDPTSTDLQSLFDEARASPFGCSLMTSFIRSMKLASYSIENIGHYGLCLEHYTHFTSPIRRYIDLIVHRILLGEEMGSDYLEEIAQICSEKERIAAKAEQSVILLKKLRYLKQQAETSNVFEAKITKVKPNGFIFEISSCFLEGFVPIEWADFDERTLELYSHRVYRIGDTVQVILESLDLLIQEASWKLPSPPTKSLKRKASR